MGLNRDFFWFWRTVQLKSMTGQCHRQGDVEYLRVLVCKQYLLLVVATRFAMRDTILSATLSYRAL